MLVLLVHQLKEDLVSFLGDLIYLENYRATLAHKINHNFHYNCTEWFFQHPRHGLIPSIIATSDLEKGQELYLHYGKIGLKIHIVPFLGALKISG